jgi:hypothetical protein
MRFAYCLTVDRHGLRPRDDKRGRLKVLVLFDFFDQLIWLILVRNPFPCGRPFVQ